jgi:WD40 repeat protein
MASASWDGTVKIWNYENEGAIALLTTLRKRLQSFPYELKHIIYVRSLILLPDGNLVSSVWDTFINIWNLTAIYGYPNRSNLIPYQ